ncbi:MAG: TIGR00282 family metallophosphoesterase [Deltaproteobacteria bacterium]|nr:TIGR00282 family metallophosphoesterase [Deltaproteobacteria bacterium]
MANLTRILFIGDIIGRPGRFAVRSLMPSLLSRFKPDVVIANGENSAGGFGITPEIYHELLSLDVDVITSGNHIWDKKEMAGHIAGAPMLLRPANYPPDAPGKGSIIFECPSGVKVGVISLCGRVFMEALDCPFRKGLENVERLKEETPVIFVDMHAEATSEKMAMGWYLAGKVSAVIGSHTHVQTSDERILDGHTAYITDAGMTGPTDSVIGVEKGLIIKRFLTQVPVRFEVAEEGVEFQGVFIEVDSESGRAVKIKRIKEGVG